MIWIFIAASLVAAAEPLRDVARAHGIVTDKFTSHNYEFAYDEYLPRFLAQPTVRMLEIGLGCGQDYGPGASVALWHAYFGPRLDLHVMEYDEPCGRAWRGNATMHYGDQADVHALRRVADRGPFDIIVDDGGHRWTQQTASLNYLFKHALAPGGAYFLEDTITSFIRGQYADAPVSTAQFLARTIDDMALSFDGVLITIGMHPRNRDLADLVFRIDAVPGMYVLSKISDRQRALVKAKGFKT